MQDQTSFDSGGESNALPVAQGMQRDGRMRAEGINGYSGAGCPSGTGESVSLASEMRSVTRLAGIVLLIEGLGITSAAGAGLMQPLRAGERRVREQPSGPSRSSGFRFR
jgi:hypothetical protein